MVEHVAYRIDAFPGCAGAGRQAVDNADRGLCATVSAWASTVPGSRLQGTLGGREPAFWYAEQATKYGVSLDRMSQWASAVGGERNYARALDVVLDEEARHGGYLRLRDKPEHLQLDGYQRMALHHLTPMGGCLALGVGLGKTLTTVALACALADLRPDLTARLWIFAPLNAFGEWEPWETLLTERYKEVRILSHDSAHKYVGAEDVGGVLVLDEAHAFGGTDARRTKALHTIRARFDYAALLTGTLTHAGVEKTLSLADLAVPGMALFSNKWKAGEHFKCIIKNQFGAALANPSGASRDAFNEWLARWCVNLTKHSPEVKATIRDPIPEQELSDVLIAEPWGDVDTLAVGIARQLLEETGEVPPAQRVIHRLCQLGIEEKLAWLLERIDAPVVVFAHYTASLDAAGLALDAAGIPFVRVDGDVPQDERPALNARFQSGEVQVFLGQAHAAGIAIQLTRAVVSVSLNHSWNPVDYAQSLGRTCRRGQPHQCYHFDLVANKLQKTIVHTLRAGAAFDAQCAEWQALARTIKGTAA